MDLQTWWLLPCPGRERKMRVTGSSVTASPHAGTMDMWMSVLWGHGSGLCVSQQRGLWKLLTAISQAFMRLQDKLSCCLFYSGVVCGTWLWCSKHTLIIKLTYYSMLSLLRHILDGQPSNRAPLSLSAQNNTRWNEAVHQTHCLAQKVIFE